MELEIVVLVAKTLETICCDDARKSSRTEVALMNVLESIWLKFAAASKDYEASLAEEEPDRDDIYNLNMSLRKIAVFYGCHSFDKVFITFNFKIVLLKTNSMYLFDHFVLLSIYHIYLCAIRFQ